MRPSHSAAFLSTSLFSWVITYEMDGKTFDADCDPPARSGAMSASTSDGTSSAGSALECPVSVSASRSRSGPFRSGLVKSILEVGWQHI